MVKHCKILSRSFQREKDGRFSLKYFVAHVNKECEVTCHTSNQKVTKKVLVIGKDIQIIVKALYDSFLIRRWSYHIEVLQCNSIKRNPTYFNLLIKM